MSDLLDFPAMHVSADGSMLWPSAVAEGRFISASDYKTLRRPMFSSPYVSSRMTSRFGLPPLWTEVYFRLPIQSAPTSDFNFSRRKSLTMYIYTRSRGYVFYCHFQLPCSVVVMLSPAHTHSILHFWYMLSRCHHREARQSSMLVTHQCRVGFDCLSYFHLKHWVVFFSTV